MFFLALNKFYCYFQSYQLLQCCGFISLVILDGIEIRFQNIHIQEHAALHWLGVRRRWNHAEKYKISLAISCAVSDVLLPPSIP